MAETNRKTLTHVEFHRASKVIMQNEGEFQAGTMTRDEACAKIASAVGFDIAHCTLKQLYEVNGIPWVFPRTKASKGSRRDKAHSREVMRATVRALRSLYLKLNEPVPAGLESAYARLELGKEPEPVGSRDADPMAWTNGELNGKHA